MVLQFTLANSFTYSKAAIGITSSRHKTIGKLRHKRIIGRLFAVLFLATLMPTAHADVRTLDLKRPSATILDYLSRGQDPLLCYENSALRYAINTGQAHAPHDCPVKMMLQGFPVYVSRHIAGREAFAVFNWLDNAQGVLAELEGSGALPPYFIERLRESGVAFNLTGPDDDYAEDAQHDPYNFCSSGRGCYVPGLRLVNASFPSWYEGRTYSPDTSWNGVRGFIVHELAHAYHDIAVAQGFGNRCVLDAYNYSVRRDGLHAGDYAATNELEYFAEMVNYSVKAPSFQDGLTKGLSVEVAELKHHHAALTEALVFAKASAEKAVSAAVSAEAARAAAEEALAIARRLGDARRMAQAEEAIAKAQAQIDEAWAQAAKAEAQAAEVEVLLADLEEELAWWRSQAEGPVFKHSTFQAWLVSRKLYQKGLFLPSYDENGAGLVLHLLHLNAGWSKPGENTQDCNRDLWWPR